MSSVRAIYGATERRPMPSVIGDSPIWRRSAVDRIVPRPELVERLLQSVGTPLVAVTAPTGYGKTTLLSQWADKDPRPFVWLTATAIDDDPIHLLRRLVGFLDRLVPLPADVADALDRPSPQMTTVVLPRLTRALAALPDPYVIVIDDAHLLESAGSAHCLDAILDRLPDGSQLVLAGQRHTLRSESARRLDGTAFQLGAGELALQIEEAGELFRRLRVHASPDAVRMLADRTEGWPAGLALAALSLGGDITSASTATNFTGHDRLLADYLTDRLLHALPAETMSFLLQSSVLVWLGGDLCDAVLKRSGSGALLEEFVHSGNLFVVPVDGDRRWYRYHQLFGELLRAELHARDPGLEQELHRRASIELEVLDDIDGAVRHARAAGDVARAAELISARVISYSGEGRQATIGLWIDLFTEAEIAGCPTLALARAWYGVTIGDGERLPRWVAVAARQTPVAGPMPDGAASYAASLSSLRAMMGVGGLAAVVDATDEVRLATAEHNWWWAHASMMQAAARIMLGEPDRALALLQAAGPTIVHVPAGEAVLLAHLAQLAADDGRWDEADAHIEASQRLVDEERLHDYVPLLPGFAISAQIAAHQGAAVRARLDIARTRRLLARIAGLAPRHRLHAYTQLALAEQALGDAGRVAAMVQQAEKVLAEEPAAVHERACLEQLQDWLKAPSPKQARTTASLTDAQLRVLEFLPTHLSFKEIGQRLFLSRNTVKSHAVAIYLKLGVSSRSAAVERARELDLIED